MSREIEDFVEDLLGDLEDRIQEFLEEQDRKYQERARLGVVLSESWNGYNALIGGHRIHIEHDSSWHRWRFKDEDYNTFLELSEKKGEAVVQFLRGLAKLLSPRTRAPNDKNIAQRPLDPEAASEDSFEED